MYRNSVGKSSDRLRRRRPFDSADRGASTSDGSTSEIGELTTETSGQENAPVQVGSIGVHGGVTSGPSSATSDLPGSTVEDGQGDLWFTEPNNGLLERVTPQGQVEPFAADVLAPQGITLGPGGNIWYTGDNAIGEIAPTGGTPQVFSLSGLSDEPVLARAITAGPDGDLWFTTDSNSIGQISPSGQAQLFTQGITGEPTLGIAATSNEVYFTEGSSQKIGVVSFCGAVVCQPGVIRLSDGSTGR
jgi:streptogramin lyase